MFVNIDHFNTQVKLFSEHLCKNYLVGFIVDSSIKGKNERKSWLIPLSLHSTEEKLLLTETQSLYFLPQVSDGLDRKDENITNIRTLLIDIDEVKNEINFGEFQPNVYIKRTDNRAIQAFYFLDHDITQNEFVTYQQALQYKFGNEKITSISHGGRICGVRRGEKKKDIKHNIATGLSYELISYHSNKLSKAAVQDFLGLIVPAAVINPAQKTDLSKILTAVDDDVKFYPFEKDFNARFYHFKELNGVKTIEKIKTDRSNTLYRFSCCLIDKKLDLRKFKNFCDRNSIPACDISGCDEEEFEKVYHDSLKYAKSLKDTAKTVEKNAVPISEVGIDLESLYSTYKELRRIKNELNSYYFVEDEDVFYKEEVDGNLTKINKNTFNTKFKVFTSITKEDGTKTPSQPVSLFLSKLTANHFNVVASTTYVPHAPRIFYRGRMLLNTWRYPNLKTEKLGNLTIFLEHIRWMFEGQKSLGGLDLGEFFLDYLAYVYCNQNPAKFSWLLYAKNMGIGRSFFSKLFADLMGRDNVSVPTPELANEKYTGWYSTKQFAVVEELVEDLGFYDKLKPIIGNELVTHREMHKNSTISDNYCNILLLSNKIDCLKVVEGDRRLLVVHMHQPVQLTSYYDALYEWKNVPENIYALSQFLIERNKNINTRTMLGHAPLTTAKTIMQQVSIDSPLQELSAYVAENLFGQNKEFVSRDDILESRYKNISKEDALAKYGNSTSKNLLALGYVPILYSKQKRLVKDQNPVRLTIYVKSFLAEKYLKDEDAVVLEYKIKKGFIKREDVIDKEPAVIDSEMALEKVTKIEPEVDIAPSTPKNPDKPIKKKSGKEKIHDLVLEAQRRATSTIEAAVVTFEDLLRIREERTRQDVDVTFLLK